MDIFRQGGGADSEQAAVMSGCRLHGRIDIAGYDVAADQIADVVDDKNILFHMRDGTVYRNKLLHKCPGLRFEETFLYRTTIGQLCNLDLITVLNDAGFGFTHGPSCGLGQFYPISEDEVKLLKEQKSG